MEQKQTARRWIRVGVAVLIGLLLLAAALPSTGGIIHGPSHPGMWRFGPFLFYPELFFGVVGGITVATACTVFGIVRRSALEFVGWALLGVLFFLMLMA